MTNQWFWDRLDQEAKGYDELPLWMKRDGACPSCGSIGGKGTICRHPEPMGDKFRL